MKAIFFEVPGAERERLEGVLEPLALDVEIYEDKLTEETAHLAEEAEVVSVFINSVVSASLLAKLPNLKFVATRSTGFDHIDLGATGEREVTVSNVPAYGSRSVAEFTFALMLSVCRRVFLARHQLLEGDNFDMSGLEGIDLNDKTLGVVGTGKIGKNVVKIAKAFGMEVVAYDIYPDEEFSQEHGFNYVELDELLRESDIVTLHTPYNKDTHHLINAGNIGLFKDGAYLINTARGELVETDALIQALASGKFAGAGLDVLESERELKEEVAILAKGSEHLQDFKTLYENQVLLDMPQVVVTPHIAFCTREAKSEINEITVANIKSFIQGKPQNQVNKNE